MKFSTWLDAEKGRTTSVARHFKRTLGAISQWRKGVPPKRMTDLRDFTNGDVTLEEMLAERAASPSTNQPKRQTQEL